MKPSRFDLNADYATPQNDAKGMVTLVIPPSFTVPAGSTISPFESSITLGKRAAGMRFNLSSSKYPRKSILSPNFEIPCTSIINGISSEDSLIGYFFRPTPTTVGIHVDPNYSGALQDYGGTITDCGQVLTLRANSFLSPFES